MSTPAMPAGDAVATIVNSVGTPADGPHVALPEPTYLDDWLAEQSPMPGKDNFRLLLEQPGRRAAAMPSICAAVRDHLVGADILSSLDFPAAATAVRESLPTSKKIRSGDLGEILGTEYVQHRTKFSVPVKRLRYKDDRNMSMRGDDIIGVQIVDGRTLVLKCEVKSRAYLGEDVVDSAIVALRRGDSRPKSATLAFLWRMLRREQRDAEARLILRLMSQTPRHEDITHLVFVLAGNDPSAALAAYATPEPPIAERRLIGLRIPDHQSFIASVFEILDAAGSERADRTG